MFGIPKVERKVFKRNFLRTAILSLNYSTNTSAVAHLRIEIENLFKDFEITPINRGLGVQIKFEGGKQILESLDGDNEVIGFDLKSASDDLQINIQSGKLTLKINSEQYTSFDSLAYYVPKIKELFNILKLKSYSNLSIRKINVLELEKTEVVKDPAQVLLKTFINKRLIGDISYFGNTDYVASNINSLTLNDGNYSLNLRYGMNSPKGFNEEIRHILIDIETSVNGPLSLEKLEGELGLVNQSIYNTFNWVISDTFKEILDNEQINEV